MVCDDPLQVERSSADPEHLRVLPDGADVVVFQRIFRPEMLRALRSFRAQGVAVVVDLDDDLLALSPRHPVFAELHPRTDTGRSWAVLQQALREADLVTVSTPALQAKFGGRRTRLVENCVPRAYLGIRPQQPPSSLPLLGWTGTPAMHPGDLEVIGDSVQRLCREGRARFRVIGDRAALDLLGVPEQEHRPGVELADLSYAREYAQLEVALVPLRDSVFNRSKSWLKLAEASALGLPAVCSPSAENLRLGLGLIARRPREWRAQLERLLGSAELRLARGVLARERMQAYTIEGRMIDQLWSAWSEAASLRRAA